MLTTTTKTARTRRQDPKPKRGVGIIPGNPKRCLICQKEIQATDRWLKYTSPSDPDLGSYSIIVHQECERRAR